jgi:aquaporin related protein
MQRNQAHISHPGDYYTGGSLNPARSLGPDVINRNFPGYHWIYWVGPLLGSLLASGFYHFLCLVRWERINPGQDYNEVEVRERKESFGPSERTVTNESPPHEPQVQEPTRVVPPEEQV